MSQLSTVKKFVSSEDGEEFKELVKKHYKGFVHVPSRELAPPCFYTDAKRAFETLRQKNYYHYDVVMAGGKHCSRTFVKRTLVGCPGITYKYLSLRLFAHPWSGPDAIPMMKSICNINKSMIEMTKEHTGHGLCDYNLTLINDMPSAAFHSSVGFKEEAFYGMGKVSVSWHADSSLQNGSSIGVCHFVSSRKATPCDWRIALRPSPSGENGVSSDIPPISVRTADGDAYFLLGSFNEKYQHCVLAGSSQHRISSTHRVATIEKDTYQYILRRSKTALKRLRTEVEKDEARMDYRVVLFSQKVLTELEMEWVAQYWLQGSTHNKLHVWWHKPMETLESLWENLEELTHRVYTRCIEASSAVPRAVVVAILEEFKIRQRLRQLWDERRADAVYKKRMKEDQRPIARPQFHDRKDCLPKSLSTAIQMLASVRVQKQISTVDKTNETNHHGVRKAQKSSAAKKKRPSSSSRKKEVHKRKRETEEENRPLGLIL
ncbi:unnamed protein product [Cylindrotheca closterium]|uniref:Alpha-ketoglutarate-dependent dioxygenase FTO n=1 Tax=Cylindrotheca closterium TaxID=2856 RepID=A0AAD2GAH1_9STRA|nr:unnamed protein product [Cylindrotheca closterium]